ncbi:MAG: sodium-dependent bicarbonate transport family permease [Ilumatobacteraceae bacterium]
MFAASVVDNLLTAPVLAFVVALVATHLRFDLRLPESLYPILSTFLLLAIGLKGGRALAETSLGDIWQPILAALALGVVTPLVAFAAFRALGGIGRIDAAAIAAHYGSVSAVTFTVVLATLDSRGMSYEGHVAGLLAILEVIGIVVALALARDPKAASSGHWGEAIREVLRGRSIAFLLAGIIVGLAAGPERLTPTDPLFVGLFSGVLTLFLIEMGSIAAERLRDVAAAGWRLVALAIIVPLVNGTIGAVAGNLAGLSTGGVAVLATLAASASYIAAPAAVRIALPEASPGLYVTASLGITFPFNLIVGIPIYISIAEALT